jgi:hypothetical protein
MDAMLKWVVSAGAVCLLAGCAAAPLMSSAPLLLTGGASSEFHSGTAVRLDEANFMTVKTNVTGQAKGFALLGIFTLSPARFGTAMDRLYGTADVRVGRPQTLANVVAERSSSYYVLFSIPRVEVRADVVEFISPREERREQR